MRKLLALSLVLLLLAIPAFAGRDCDGTDDEISFGSDAGIDNFATRTIALWVRSDDTGATQIWATKGAANAHVVVTSNTTDAVRYISDWTTDGNWIGTTDVVDAATFFHVCITYDQGATTNDPVIIVNSATETLATDTAPTGTVVADAANDLQICESNADVADFDGIIAFFNYDNEAWTAAACNMARWYGTRGGNVSVYHTFDTDKLSNEGSGTADGTATGTTVVSTVVPVERRYGSLMGVGR